MQNAHFIQHLVLKISEIFFFTSIALLVVFFILKAFLDIKRKFLKKKSFQVKHREIQEELAHISPKNLPKYANYLSSLSDHQAYQKAITQIEATHLYDKLYALYDTKRLPLSRLALFHSLALLGDPKIRPLALSFTSDKEKRKKIPEFLTIELYALSLSSKNSVHIQELYFILETLDQEEYASQKFAEFFLVKAFISVEEEEILRFLAWMKQQEFNAVYFAAIYALSALPVNKRRHEALCELQHAHPRNRMLIVSFLRVSHRLGLKEPDIVLRHHNDTDDLLRIVCAKVALDMLEDSYYPLLSHYLYDPNPYVRKNFLLSLTKYHIKTETLMAWIEAHYPQHKEDSLTLKSIAQYQSGIS